MMESITVTGVHVEIDAKLRSYIERKLGGLDRLLSRHARASAHMEVTLKESKPRGGKQCHCQVKLTLPHETIVIKEATINMYAAIDITESKLKLQLKKYKAAHERYRFGRRLRDNSSITD